MEYIEFNHPWVFYTDAYETYDGQLRAEEMGNNFNARIEGSKIKHLMEPGSFSHIPKAGAESSPPSPKRCPARIIELCVDVWSVYEEPAIDVQTL